MTADPPRGTSEVDAVRELLHDELSDDRWDIRVSAAGDDVSVILRHPLGSPATFLLPLGRGSAIPMLREFLTSASMQHLLDAPEKMPAEELVASLCRASRYHEWPLHVLGEVATVLETHTLLSQAEADWLRGVEASEDADGPPDT